MLEIDEVFDFTVAEMFAQPAVFTDESLKVLYGNKAAAKIYGALQTDGSIYCFEYLKGFKKKCPEEIDHIQHCSADLLKSGTKKVYYSIHEHRTEIGLRYFLMEKFYNSDKGLFLQIHTDVTDIVSKHINNSLLNKADVESMCFKTFGVNIKSIKALVGFTS